MDMDPIIVDNMESSEEKTDSIVPPTNGNISNTLKHPLSVGEPSPIPAKRQKLSLDPGNRNPVAILNELRTGLIYTVQSQTGPSHSPMFTLNVTVDGHVYTGTGRSKKQAKHNAAESALKSFIQFPSNCKIANVSFDSNADFTSDVDTSDTSVLSQPSSAQKRTAQTTKVGKTAVMIVHELYPDTSYATMETDNAYAKFKVVATILGQDFVGTGSNKKSAKLAACTTALSKLLSTPDTTMSPITGLSAQKMEEQNLADQIGRLVNDTFLTVMKQQPAYAKRKVLAGVVLQRPEHPLQVLTVTTGTKCISGEHISINGRVLNDMHAEILARRALMHYFYTQLELLLDGETTSIFEHNTPPTNDNSDEAITNNGTAEATAVATPRAPPYRLAEGVRFHLYINTAPCGDARIFSPHEDICRNNEDSHPNRASRGQLRTKIESGEGTVPIKGVITQTWDGVLLGTRLLTMSCSDKVARWNVLGIQGALLSTLMPPIYLSTLVVGSLFHERHLYRAICGRIEATLDELPANYGLNKPLLNTIASSENRQPTRAPNFSINWLSHDPTIEVVNTLTGRTDLLPSGPEFSRLCKQALFQLYLNLLAKLPESIAKGMELTLKNSCYADLKNAAGPYQVAKQRLYDAFTKANLGQWVAKPMEQDLFVIE